MTTSLYPGDTAPIVYTGIASLKLASDAVTDKFITRLHIIRTSQTGADIPAYRATLIFYLSTDASNEYSTINYDSVHINAERRQIILTTGRLPVVILDFDHSMQKGKARFISLGREVGSIDLTNGWDYPLDADVEQNYAGIYDANCPVIRLGGAGTYHIKEIMIVPNRTNPDLQDVVPMNNDMSYAGASSCAVFGDETCTVFYGGRAQLLERRLILFEGQNAWTCQRGPVGSLSCTSPMYDCNLKKKMEIHIPYKERAALPFAPFRFLERIPTPSVPNDIDSDCAKWAGERTGMVHHRLGDRSQPVSLHMASWVEVDAQGRHQCAIDIHGELHFYTYSETPEYIVYSFPTTYVVPGAERVVMTSVSPSEITLELWHDLDGSFNGNWISNIIGYVGSIYLVTQERSGEISTPSISHGVFGLSGKYTKSILPGMWIEFRSFPRAKDPMYHPNPYYSCELEGGIQLLPDLPPLKVNRNAYYDFYTNYFLLAVGSGVSSGQIGRTDNTLSVITFSMLRHYKQGNFDAPAKLLRSTTR